MNCTIALTVLLVAAAPHPHAAPLDTASIEQLTGAKGLAEDQVNSVMSTPGRSPPPSATAVTCPGACTR